MIRRRWLTIVCVFAALATAAVFLWRMTYVPPSWYAPPDGHSQQVAELADKVEQRMLEEAQKIRAQSDHWQLKIREPQINAWLATRLTQWIEHEQNGHWPPQLGTPQVKIDPKGISLALPIHAAIASHPRVVVARVWPQMIDGHLKLEVDRLALGRVVVPGEPLANLLRMLEDSVPALAADQKFRKAVDIFAGERMVDPVTRLADHRRLRLLDFQLGDGWVDLTAQTIEAGDSSTTVIRASN